MLPFGREPIDVLE